MEEVSPELPVEMLFALNDLDSIDFLDLKVNLTPDRLIFNRFILNRLNYLCLTLCNDILKILSVVEVNFEIFKDCLLPILLV